ncbi:MAG: hypothetical protein IJB48_04035 [Clostridia bacterium]|nr:hypothetical protein [Clostridia bacterium]
MISQIYPKNRMDFLTYRNICEDILSMGDLRERIIQEFLIRPFIASVVNYDVIPTDIKVSNRNNIHNYEKYSGKSSTSGEKTVTPDLCIAKKWEWANGEKDTRDYKATIEVKSPKKSVLSCYDTARNKMYNNIMNFEKNFGNSFLQKMRKIDIKIKDENSTVTKTLYSEMLSHLQVMNHVILTDGIGWHFFEKENGILKISSICLAMRKLESKGNITLDWD